MLLWVPKQCESHGAAAANAQDGFARQLLESACSHNHQLSGRQGLLMPLCLPNRAPSLLSSFMA